MNFKPKIHYNIRMNQNQKQFQENSKYFFFGAAETITNSTAPRLVLFPFFQCLKKIAGRTIFFMLTERKE